MEREALQSPMPEFSLRTAGSAGSGPETPGHRRFRPERKSWKPAASSSSRDLSIRTDQQAAESPAVIDRGYGSILGGPMSVFGKYLRVALMISLFAGTGNVWAQATAQISGTARDQSGAVLPGVEIRATQAETGMA